MKGRSEVKAWLLLLLAVAQTTTADEGDELGFLTDTEYVTFSNFDVTLTCPETESPIKWGPGTSLTNELQMTIEDYTDEKSLHYCRKEGDENAVKYFFYIKAKVCKGCVEMHKGVVIAAMFGDIVFTLGVILVIHACAKKKSSSAAPQRAAHSRQPSAPPPPEPDYQSLNQATRSRDIYAEAGRRAH